MPVSQTYFLKQGFISVLMCGMYSKQVEETDLVHQGTAVQLGVESLQIMFIQAVMALWSPTKCKTINFE